MDKNIKRTILLIGVTTLGATLYAFYKGKNDFMNVCGGFIGLVLIVLPLITKPEQVE